MSLASLVDKPLIQNPLAGGGAMIRPQESQLQGDALVQQMQMRMQQRDQKTPAFMAYFGDVMDTKGYPTKTMQEYESQFPEYIPQQVPLGVNISNANFNTSPPGTLNLIDPSRDAQRKADEEFLKTADEYQRGFRESEFYKPFAPMTMDVAEFIYSSPTKGDITMKGSSSGIGQFGSYLESIGKGNLLKRAGGVGLQQAGPLQPSPPSLFPIKNEKGEDIGGIENTAIATVPGIGQDVTGNNPAIVPTPSTPNPIQTGGLGDQGLMDRLTSLEQGIGSLQNQIANLFQMRQASDPFGLGGFINTRRY